MPAPVRRPYVGPAPILNQQPAVDDWGQIVRPIGPMAVDDDPPTHSDVVPYPVVMVSQVIAAPRAGRTSLEMSNNATVAIYIRSGAGPCTTTNWTYKMLPGSGFWLPRPVWPGEVTCLGAGADPLGSLQVTEQWR